MMFEVNLENLEIKTKKDNSLPKNKNEKTSMSEITSQRRKETDDNYHTRSTEKDKTTYQEQR